MKKILANRSVRLILQIAAGVTVYAMMTVGIAYLFLWGYQMLFAAWGVNSENIGRAPFWARALSQSTGAMLSCLQAALVAGGLYYFKRASGIKRTKDKNAGKLARGIAVGAVGAALLFALLLSTDISRLAHPLWRPQIQGNILTALIQICASVIAAELFLRGFLFGILLEKGGRVPAYLVTVAAGMLAGFSAWEWDPWALLNRALLGLLLCRMVEKTGTVHWGIGFRCALGVLTEVVFGIARTGVVYETYPVRLYWLCGGEMGIASGALYTLLLIALIIVLNRRELRAWLLSRRHA